jgi:hypothetical protein
MHCHRNYVTTVTGILSLELKKIAGRHLQLNRNSQ